METELAQGGTALAVFSALWLGILTSISPCPLATNITAVSFIGRRVGRPLLVLSGGMLYTLGRMLTYTVLGIVLTGSLLAVPGVSFALQRYMNLALGPVLIVIGMFLLELLGGGIGRGGVSEGLAQRAERMGVLGAGLLGMLFALAFCPVSAALFFGSLFALALRNSSPVLLPALYGLGTALPVVVFAVLIALSANLVAKFFKSLSAFEWWARRVTGAVFILAGIYLSLHYIYNVL